MAMTKAEKAEFDRIRTHAALRWPMAAEPVPMTKEEILAGLSEVEVTNSSWEKTRKVAVGWRENAHNGRVERVWSTGHTCGTLFDGKLSGGSQGMGTMYRTKAEAILAMRWDMCRDFARKLFAVDQMLEAD